MRPTSLRGKTLTIVVVATLALMLAICLPLRSVILSRFEDLELALGKKDLDRARNTVDEQLVALGAMARDYGAWDDTYAFAAAPTEQYGTLNYTDASMGQNRMGLIEIADTTGKQLLGIGFDLRAAARRPPPPVAEVLPAELAAFDAAAPKPRSGFVRAGGKTFVVGAHPILTSQATGPARGTIVIGREFDQAEIERLAKQLRFDLAVVEPSAVATLGADGTAVRPIDDDTLGAYALLKDVRGVPFGVLRVQSPRTVYAQGKTDANTIAISVGIACLVFGAVVLLLLQRAIVRRVARLGSEVTAVGTARDHALRVTADGGDEIGKLATDVNTMLGSLERLTKEVEVERAKAERLLRNILPGPIADRLKDKSETIADAFPEVSVLFGDLVGFTDLSSRIAAPELVLLLNDVFSRFDALADKHGLEKIKTIGDAYMVVAGVPEARTDHAEVIAQMGLDMLVALEEFNAKNHTDLQLRVGINSGAVVAGVIGTKKFIYDLWGDAVNIASRMESSGVPGRVHIAESAFTRLDGKFAMESRGTIQVKGKGEMKTWLLGARS